MEEQQQTINIIDIFAELGIDIKEIEENEKSYFSAPNET